MINITNLREAGAPIKGIENASSGVVPVTKILEDTFSYANQLGQRNGAGVAYLNLFHPDIVDFLATKKENADEKVRLKTLSLGVIVPDKFYELVADNAVMYLFSPYDVERVYGKPFGHINITQEYDNLVKNPDITKYTINARELENEISKLQQESGYPYVINIDVANESNPVYGDIVMSNLCSEILQVQKPSIVNDKQEYEELGYDISCNLGSMNIPNLLDTPDFAKSIDVAVRALTRVSKVTSIDAVPTVKNGNDLYHSIGLGGMGLHTAFATNHMYYGDDESIELTDAYFYAVNYWSLVSSNQIAKEQGESFHEFELSDYANGTYFDKYINEPFEIQSEKVKEITKNIPFPTTEDWVNLKQSIQEHGLYNSYRQAVAP